MTADLIPAATPLAAVRATNMVGFAVAACPRAGAGAWRREAQEHGQTGQVAEVMSRAETLRVYTTQKQPRRDAWLAAAPIIPWSGRGIELAVRTGRPQEQAWRAGLGGRQRAGAQRSRGDTRVFLPACLCGLARRVVP